MTNAPETVGAGGLEGFEHASHAVAKLEVGSADDGGCGPGLAVGAAGTGRGEALHELYLTHGFQLVWSRGAVHGAGLEKHCGPHVVAGVQVVHQLVEKVSLIGDALHPTVPEMMVGVAEGDFRFDRVFLGQGQPVVISERHVDTSLRGM